LLTIKDPNARLVRWALKLQPFDFIIKYKNGKLHSDADCISRHPLEPEDEDCGIPVWISGVSMSDIPDIRNSQLKDSFSQKIRNILLDESISKRKKKYWSKRFEIINDVVYKTFIKNREMIYAMVIPKSMISNILFSCHDALTAGHMGTERTYKTISQRFYWPKMFESIRSYVKTCEKCQMNKVSNCKPGGKMVLTNIADKIFQKIGVDLVGPLPKTERNNKHIIVATDQLTKWVVAEPLANTTSEDVNNFLLNKVFLMFGIPKELITDRGTNLVSETNMKFYEQYGIKHCKCTLAHPQSDGKTERYNRVLGEGLRSFTKNQHNWDLYIHYLVFAYNTSENDATNKSPYSLLFGIEARLPVENLLGRIKNVSLEENIEVTLSNLRMDARNAIQGSHVRNKKYYDVKRSDLSFEVGDLVLTKNLQRRKGKNVKLQSKYLGPFRVFRKLSENNHQIVSLDGKPKSDIVHVEKLKPYIERQVVGLSERQ